MDLKNGHKIVFGLVLVIIAVVITMISWSGDQNNVVEELDAEPEIDVYLHDTKTIESMLLEEYIQGVVAGEMFPDWPVEAYAAQAILARSFTMAFMAEGGLQDEYGADISTNIEEAQAYNRDAVTPEIIEAVEMTRGEVMTFDNRYVKGWFHAYSGGETTSAVEGLNYQEQEPPYVTSVELGENEYAPEDVTNWRAEYSLAELQGLLSEVGINVGTIENIEIIERGATDRVTELLITGTNGTDTIHGANFRIAVDSTKMRSTLINEWEITDGVLTMTGSGYGHGVGLSQWDAFKMAKDGQTPEEIVATFFEGVELKKLYD